MVASPTFAARGLAVHVAGRPLFSGVDIELAPGETLAVTGPSGGGKSTLLRALAGLIDAAEGELRLGGKSPEELGWTAWRRRVLLAAQRPILYDTSVVDNLRRPFVVKAAEGRPFPERKARGLLAELDLPADCFDRQAQTLSEGQQQRVCLARSLLVEPDVLLLDEPTSALDPESVAHVEALLRSELRLRHGCAVIVTHDPAQAVRLGTQQLEIRSAADA